MTEDQPESRRWIPIAVCLIAAVPVLLILPLGIAACEHFIVGSDHFEDLCRRVGAHDTLRRIYRPIVDLLRGP
jgi:hypothetical protein